MRQSVKYPPNNPRLTRSLRHLLSFIAGACLVIAAVVGAIRLVVFDKGFYQEVYEAIDLAASENISDADLSDSINMMIDYVQGSRDNLDGTITWKERQQPTFNEKEISHMKDVRTLWQNAWKVFWWALGLAALCYLLLYLWTKKHFLSWVSRGILDAYACIAVLLVFFGFWMAIDFTGLWVQFHHWFFSNQLWLLDPRTDFMIVICPETLFFQMIVRIACIFGLLSILLIGFSLYYLKKKAVIGFEQL